MSRRLRLQAPDREIDGSIDILDDLLVAGWVRVPAVPHRRVVIEVECAGHRERAVADAERPDLKAAGMGDGRHGFSIAMNLRGGGPIAIRDAETGRAIPGAPLFFDPVRLLQSGDRSGVREVLRAEVQHARFALGGEDRPADAGPPLPGYATRARIATLLRPTAPDLDPHGLITAYLDHRAASAGVTTACGEPADHLASLQRYIRDEGRCLGGLPLSCGQIAYLNAFMPRFGCGPEMSVAAFNAIADAFPGQQDWRDPTFVRDAIYWWCTERAPSLAPDGSLITDAQVRVLTGGANANESYGLNDFARLSLVRDVSLAPVAGRGMLMRAVLTCVLILRCARWPYLARFLSAAALAELMAPAGTAEGTRFEALLAVAIGGEAAEIRKLSRALTDRLATFGLSLGHSSATPNGIGTAPALMPDPRIASGLEPGVAVIGPSEIVSGLGQATRQSIASLQAAGRHPAVLNYRRPFPSAVRPADAAVAPALRRPRRINLIHLNADLLPTALAELDQRIFDKSYNIGFLFWELDQVPPAHRLALELLDEVWVASEYDRDTFARACGLPVHNVGLSVEPPAQAVVASRQDYGLPDDGFIYLTAFDSFSFVDRKNPLGAILAFQAAFPKGSSEPVHLVVKTQNRAGTAHPHASGIWRTIDALVESDPRIRIIDRTMSYPDLLGLKRVCDAYVSLHRSEGLGIGMIEAMQLGRPVIATAYSGNLEFCDSETAFLVDYTLVPVRPEQYTAVAPGSRWAEPSIASAAAQMRRVHDDPTERQARTKAAAIRATGAFSAAAIGRRYDARLKVIEAGLAQR